MRMYCEPRAALFYSLELMAAHVGFPFAGHELEIYKLHSTRKSVKGFPCVCSFPMNENIPLSLEWRFCASNSLCISINSLALT